MFRVPWSRYTVSDLCVPVPRPRPTESLLRYCAVWNTNARSCLDAQAVLQVLLTHLAPEELLQYQGARGHLEGLIPYTGPHTHVFLKTWIGPHLCKVLNVLY